MKILQNAVWVPEHDTIYVSSDTHDYVSIEFKDGKEFCIDGGRSYFRRGGHFDLRDSGRVVDISLTTEHEFSTKIAQQLVWGSRGKDGRSPLKFNFIKNLEADHLQAILDNCPNASFIHKLTIKYWLEKKKEEALLKNNAPMLTLSGICPSPNFL